MERCWKKVRFLREPVAWAMLPDAAWHAALHGKNQQMWMLVWPKQVCSFLRTEERVGNLLIPAAAAKNEVLCSGVHLVSAVQSPEQLLPWELPTVPAVPPVHFLCVVGKMRKNVR